MNNISARYLTIILRRRVEDEMVVTSEARSAELAIIISYPASTSGIIFLFKMPKKYREFFPTLFANTIDFQQTRIVIILGEHSIMVHIPWAKPIRALELHYPMIQFLIKRSR